MAKTEDNVSTPSSHGLSAAASQRREEKDILHSYAVIMATAGGLRRSQVPGLEHILRSIVRDAVSDARFAALQEFIAIANDHRDEKWRDPALVDGVIDEIIETVRSQSKLNEPRGLSASEQPCCEAVINNPVDPTQGERGAAE